LIDDPLLGLDQESIARLDLVLKEYRSKGEERDEKRLIIMTSSSLTDAQRLCDRVVTLRDGEIVKSGDDEQPTISK
jgi:ABC-type multidrug transport system ATPase subunit